MLLALAVVLLVYGAALGHGFVHDDVTLLAESARLDDLRQLPRALVHDVFWLADGRVRPTAPGATRRRAASRRGPAGRC